MGAPGITVVQPYRVARYGFRAKVVLQAAVHVVQRSSPIFEFLIINLTYDPTRIERVKKLYSVCPRPASLGRRSTNPRTIGSVRPFNVTSDHRVFVGVNVQIRGGGA